MPTNKLKAINSCNDLANTPLEQFNLWFNTAKAAKIPQHNAMNLATVDSSGKPSSRVVLLKSATTEGFAFFTNYNSRKAKDIINNPYVALTFYWPELARQIRIEGKTTKTTADISASYFSTRPKDSQIAAYASKQSQTLKSKRQLTKEFAAISEIFTAQTIPCPDFWGGFIVKPNRFEFWIEQKNRLHDRFLYTLNHDGNWLKKMLYP